MKRIAVFACMLAFCVVGVTRVHGQAASAPNVLSELWNFEDAVPLPTGQVDLRLTGHWFTGATPGGFGNVSDSFSATPSVVWGVANNFELSANVPIYLGDGGSRPGGANGNGDTYVGGLWRFAEPDGVWPAMALSGTIRVPTASNSHKVDVELRLVMTKDYDSGMRSHVNVFGTSVNGDVISDNERTFQWGAVVGMDGPLCSDGAVRWVADYMHRSSHVHGHRDNNLLELGWEWDIEAGQKLGMKAAVGLNGDDNAPNIGVGFTYSYTIVN